MITDNSLFVNPLFYKEDWQPLTINVIKTDFHRETPLWFSDQFVCFLLTNFAALLRKMLIFEIYHATIRLSIFLISTEEKIK